MNFLKSIILWVLFAPFLFGAPTFPALNGMRVVDEAALLSSMQKSSLENTLALHEANTSNQIVVVTLKSLQGYDIADYGYQLGRYWGIGTSKFNNGLLLIVAPNERRVRIEVGYGLEGALPDATAQSILDEIILPLFKQSLYADGIISGTHAIIQAIKGEYQVSKAQQSSKNDKRKKRSFLIFVMITALVVHGMIVSLPKDAKLRNGFSVLLGFIYGIGCWLITGDMVQSVVLGFIVFLVALLGIFESETPMLSTSRGSGGTGGHSGNDYSSSWSDNIFSGGGGSFGGGGASGSW